MNDSQSLVLIPSNNFKINIGERFLFCFRDVFEKARGSNFASCASRRRNQDLVEVASNSMVLVPGRNEEEQNNLETEKLCARQRNHRKLGRFF